MTQYVYDAEGQRVAKRDHHQLAGELSTGSTCAGPSGSGLTLTNVYLRGLHGDQDTELDGQGNLVHINAYVEGGVTATYWNAPSTGWGSGYESSSYEFSDWEGTKRAQVNATGLENYWQSDPYGDYQTALTSNGDATEHHYTQKERDTESGNDYFGARYYTSLIGRFMSPDWSAKVEPVPYMKVGDPQSLNLFAFVGNNPLTHVDVDGHAPLSWGGFEDCSEQHNCNGGGQTAMETWQNRSAQIVDEVAERGGYGHQPDATARREQADEAQAQDNLAKYASNNPVLAGDRNSLRISGVDQGDDGNHDVKYTLSGVGQSQGYDNVYFVWEHQTSDIAGGQMVGPSDYITPATGFSPQKNRFDDALAGGSLHAFGGRALDTYRFFTVSRYPVYRGDQQIPVTFRQGGKDYAFEHIFSVGGAVYINGSTHLQ